MTERIGAMAIDGTPISASDVARMEAEEILHAEWQRKAVLVVAGSAADASDCRLLLDILGLDPKVVAVARHRAPGADPAKPASKGRALAA
jgi:hypothetical protein